MKRISLLGGLAFALLLLAARAEPDGAKKRFERALEVYQSVEAAVPMQRALYLEELKAGAASGVWPEWYVDAVELRFKRLESSRSKEAGRAPNAALSTSLDLQSLLDASSSAIPPNSATQRFRSQLSVMDSVKRESLIALRANACQYAREVWLAAKNAADLQPAVAALLEAKATIDRGQWLAGIGMIRLRSQERRLIFAQEAFVGEVFDTLSILGSTTPLLLPDPVADAAGYAEACDDWSALRSIDDSFIREPEINARFLELEFRRQTEEAARRGRLHAALFSGASPVQLRKLVSEFSALFPIARRRDQFGGRNASISRSANDYKKRIERVTQQPRQRSTLELEAYGFWLRFLENKPESEDPISENQLRQKLAPLPPLLFEALLKQAVKPKPAAALPSEMIAALRQVAEANSGIHGDVARRVIDVWEKLDMPNDSVTNPASGETFSLWMMLAADSRNVTLFTLREWAAKEVLARIAPGLPDGPFETLLVEALEKSLEESRFDTADRLLDLAAASGTMEPGLLSAYQSGISALRETPSEPGNSAQETLIQLVATTPILKISDLAARKLKKLRRPVP